MKIISLLISGVLIVALSCTNEQHKNKNKEVKTTTNSDTTTISSKEENPIPVIPEVTIVIDSTYDKKLTELSALIAGDKNYPYVFFKEYAESDAFKDFSAKFEKKWKKFEDEKLNQIVSFSKNELSKQIPVQSIFYPFSGPDIIYPTALFGYYDKMTMIGLEPTGTLPIIDDTTILPDSLNEYYSLINTSLHAILKFSFFRTASMKEDLRNEDVDGTIHLMLLFLHKTGHKIQSIKPFFITDEGKKSYITSTIDLARKGLKNKSIKLIVIDSLMRRKEITYTSANLSDVSFPKNQGLITYIEQINHKLTYLKGASYLMHYTSFSGIRNLILKQCNTIVQDDSGIAIKYILADSTKWHFDLYGQYTKPIRMFAKEYQPDLDSLYKKSDSKDLGFGLGYNYRDKNSSFMIIKKEN